MSIEAQASGPPAVAVLGAAGGTGGAPGRLEWRYVSPEARALLGTAADAHACAEPEPFGSRLLQAFYPLWAYLLRAPAPCTTELCVTRAGRPVHLRVEARPLSDGLLVHVWDVSGEVAPLSTACAR